MTLSHRQSGEVATSCATSSVRPLLSWQRGCRFTVRLFAYTHRKKLTMSTSYYADRINLYILLRASS
jgi:hypothetical protein